MSKQPADYVIGKVIDQNIVKGKVRLPERTEPIDATFDPDVERDEDDWDSAVADLVEQSRKLIDELRPERLSTIISNAAEEVTEAAYEQSDHAPDEADYERITKNCRLTEIGFFPGGAMLIFSAPDAFPSELLYVQVDDTLEIEDITVN